MKAGLTFVLLLIGAAASAQQSHPGPFHKTSDWITWPGDGGGGGGNDDLLLANCLATAVAAYADCVKNAPSVIPFVTAYNMGVCEAQKTKDVADCHTKYDR